MSDSSKSPSSSASASTSSSPCAPCRRMLQQVLERHESRPRSLLASMLHIPGSVSSSSTSLRSSSGLNWRESPSGNIQVQIPTEEATRANNTKRRWSRLPHGNVDNNHPSSSSPNPSKTSPLQRFTTPPLMQATSVLKQASAETTTQQGQQHPPHQQKNDVMKDFAIATSSILPSLIMTSSTSTTNATTRAAENTVSSPTSETTEWMNVSCEVCPNTGPKGKARAFVNGPNPLDVVVCSNRLRYPPHTSAALQEMEEILTHELVHVYDVRARNLDLRQCDNLAYSEVRAAREAECRYVGWGFQKSCVHERALLATRNLFPVEQARECVARVFDTALADTQPNVETKTDATRKSGTDIRTSPWTAATSQR